MNLLIPLVLFTSVIDVVAIDVLKIAIDVIGVSDKILLRGVITTSCLLFVLQVIMHDQHRKGLSL